MEGSMGLGRFRTYSALLAEAYLRLYTIRVVVRELERPKLGSIGSEGIRRGSELPEHSRRFQRYLCWKV